MKQHRIATIQDLSCFGKCSPIAAVPLISAMGLEVCNTDSYTVDTPADFQVDVPRPEDIPKIIEH